jgi:hypothetical protein
LEKPLSRIEEDGRNWLSRPKLYSKSCRVVRRRGIMTWRHTCSKINRLSNISVIGFVFLPDFLDVGMKYPRHQIVKSGHTRKKSTSKLQIVIEKKQMVIMTYKQHLFFKVISIQI